MIKILPAVFAVMMVFSSSCSSSSLPVHTLKADAQKQNTASGYAGNFLQTNVSREFLGISENEEKLDGPMGAVIITKVMESSYNEYLRLKKEGKITHEKHFDNWIYYAVDDYLSIHQPDGSSGIFTQIRRYKVKLPGQELNP